MIVLPPLQWRCINAVRLHDVADDVNRDLRAARVADTEARILRAATGLFLAQGYPATTLTAVAHAAGVAERTVYVRFGTKAALLKRAVDVAIVGDTLPVDVQGRDWFRLAMTAPTVAARIAALASAGRGIMQRAGAILAVAFEVEATDPVLVEAGRQGRLATRDSMRAFWRQAAEDGLLPDGTDVEWLGDISGLLSAAETYRLITRTLDWDLDRYERWYRETMTRLLAASAVPGGLP
jgi:AcrR family transcriptional regulator